MSANGKKRRGLRWTYKGVKRYLPDLTFNKWLEATKKCNIEYYTDVPMYLDFYDRLQAPQERPY